MPYEPPIAQEELRKVAALPPSERYKAASELVGRAGATVVAAKRLRAEAANDIRRDGNLSFAALARELGMSKTRAAQLIAEVHDAELDE